MGTSLIGCKDHERPVFGCPGCIARVHAPHDPRMDHLKRSERERARTQRQHESLHAGVHPATGLPLRQPMDQTCGSCEHLVVRVLGKTYFKCELHLLGVTGGLATDIRKSWPACTSWREGGGLT